MVVVLAQGEEGLTFPISRQGLEQIAIALVVGAAVFGALAFWRYRGRRHWRRAGASAATMAVLAAVALVLGYTVAPNIPTPPVPVTARFLQNPVPDTPEQVTTGRELYQRSCVVCHGANGRGDGPAAFTLNPRPVDLVVHTPQHAPGEVFYWISGGIPNTAMPGWNDRLSDTQRWQIVRFLYALAAGQI